MYDFISLTLTCPTCGKSLSDNEVLVDNEPSVKLKIEIGDKKGTINLSSIYGSYSQKSDIELPPDSIAKFYCPHCDAQITSDAECDTCDAPMVMFYLDIGGRVNICSRNGCKEHAIEFNDFSTALKKLYQEHGFRGRPYPDLHLPDYHNWKKKRDEAQEIIESGSYLKSYCPHCSKTLLEDGMLKLKVHRETGDEGFLYLSPFLNIFTSKSTIVLPEDKTIDQIKCPHCDKSLIIPEGKCEECGTSVAKIAISARTKLIDFYFCAKKGCRWHGLNDHDLDEIRLEDSMEW